MYARATTTVTVKRSPGGFDPDTGDPVDENGAVAALETVLTGIPVSLIERRRQVFDPVSGTARTIRYCTARATANTDIREDDQLTDEKTSTVYTVTSVHQPQSPVHLQDLTIDLQRVDSSTN